MAGVAAEVEGESRTGGDGCTSAHPLRGALHRFAQAADVCTAVIGAEQKLRCARHQLERAGHEPRQIFFDLKDARGFACPRERWRIKDDQVEISLLPRCAPEITEDVGADVLRLPVGQVVQCRVTAAPLKGLA